MTDVKTGDRVQVHYTGRLQDGTVFDSSEGRDPLEFTAGGDEVIPGFSRAVLGMEPGQNLTVTIAADDAYGPRVDGLTQQVNRSLLPDNVSVGDPLQADLDEGPLIVWVSELNDAYAVIDANHPLAGRDLVFEIELVTIVS